MYASSVQLRVRRGRGLRPECRRKGVDVHSIDILNYRSLNLAIPHCQLLLQASISQTSNKQGSYSSAENYERLVRLYDSSPDTVAPWYQLPLRTGSCRY